MTSWIDAFFGGYNTVQSDGSPVFQRPTVNYIGATVTDDPITKVTTVTIPAPSPGSPQVNAKLVATLNITLSGTQTIDGVSAVVDDVVLVAGQTAAAENGLRKVAAGIWPRTTDTLTRGMAVYIQQGTTNGGATFTLLGSGPIVPDTTPLVFQNLNDEFDIRKFGAVQGSDIGPALRLARDAAENVGRGTILLPHGTWDLLTSETRQQAIAGVVIGSDNINILGPGRGRCFLQMNQATPGVAFIPICFQKQGVSDLEPQEIKNVGVDGFTLHWLVAGPQDSGTVQFNRCTNVHVAVDILANGTGMNNSLTDGIACAWHCRNVYLDNIVVDGISKSGIYLSWCQDVRGAVIVRNGKNTVLNPIPGVGIGGAFDVELGVNCYGMDGPGVDIAVIQGHNATIGTVSNQTHFTVSFPVPTGPMLAAVLGIVDTTTTHTGEVLDVASVSSSDGGNTYSIVLNVAPQITLVGGAPIFYGCVPARAVKIRGSSHNNGEEGVVFATSTPGIVSRDITLEMVIHDNGQGGAFAGINALAVNGLVLDVVAYNNPAGVIVQDIGAGVGVENQTTNVTIPSSARIIDNATIGLSIGAVLNLAIADGFTVARTLTSLQATGIQFTKQDVVTTAKRPAGIRIGRIGHAGYSGSIFDYPNGTADAPNDGGSIYEIDFTGSPESAYLAPIGSKFVDRTSGQHYIKSTAGTSNTGWVRVMRDNDPTIITPIVENTAGALELFAHVGSNVFVGTDDTTLYWGMGAGGEIRNFSITTYIETQTPTLTITQRTTDNPTHNWSFSGQVPFASATGTNRDGGGFDFLTAVPVSGGVKGSFRIRYNGTTYFEVQGDAIAWFNGTPVTKQTVTGSLSTVVDPAAKAVLTSIIAAFAGASGYNLITDGTM